MFYGIRKVTVGAILLTGIGVASQAQAFGGFFGSINKAVDLYSNVKAGAQMYHSYDLVKTIRTAEPLFRDYDYVMVRVEINPRETEAGHDLSAAFKKNMHFIIEKDTQTSGDYLRVCESECAGRTLVIQFKETGYDRNLIQKLTVGDMLRGELYYLNYENAEVLKIENLEIAKDYIQLLQEIHMSVVSKIIKSMNEEGGQQDEKEMRKMVEEYNTFDPVMPEYRELFSRHG